MPKSVFCNLILVALLIYIASLCQNIMTFMDAPKFALQPSVNVVNEHMFSVGFKDVMKMETVFYPNDDFLRNKIAFNRYRHGNLVKLVESRYAPSIMPQPCKLVWDMKTRPDCLASALVQVPDNVEKQEHLLNLIFMPQLDCFELLWRLNYPAAKELLSRPGEFRLLGALLFSSIDANVAGPILASHLLTPLHSAFEIYTNHIRPAIVAFNELALKNHLLPRDPAIGDRMMGMFYVVTYALLQERNPEYGQAALNCAIQEALASGKTFKKVIASPLSSADDRVKPDAAMQLYLDMALTLLNICADIEEIKYFISAALVKYSIHDSLQFANQFRTIQVLLELRSKNTNNANFMQFINPPLPYPAGIDSEERFGIKPPNDGADSLCK